MFIENINHQNINTKFNLLDAQKKDSENFIDYIKIALGEISKNQNHAKIDSEKFIFVDS